MNDTTNTNSDPQHIAPAPQPAHEPAPQQTPGEPEREHALIGPIIGVMIVLLVLALGGLYLWGSTLTEEEVMHDPADEIEMVEEDATTAAPSEANDLETLEEELDEDIADIENDLEDIDAAFESESSASDETR